MKSFQEDISNAIVALEYYIIMEAEELVGNNSGDSGWRRLNSYEESLKNLKYLRSIYT